jgi:chromate transporter
MSDLAAADDRTTSPRAGAPSACGLFFAFLRLGAVSFGGPAMVAYIKRLAVARKGWLGEDEFQQGVALCQTLPGATAMQSAAYVGLRVRGLRGAVAAFTGFGLPAALLMVALSIAYQHALHVPALVAMLVGLRALVVALVANATWTFAGSSVDGVRGGLLALATAVLFFVGASPFVIVVAAGVCGAGLLHDSEAPPAPPPQPARARELLMRPVLVLGFAAAFVGALALYDRRLVLLSAVLMRIDAFAFGGGFASVPLMFRELVAQRHWLPESVFLDGIALGQITPGPIVITATFVSHQMAGVVGAVVGTISIFLPSLFAVVLVEPWFARLRARPAFRGATRGFVLSFVGLLASVTVQFGRLVDWRLPSALLALGALVALRLKVDVVWVVLAGALVSAVVM